MSILIFMGILILAAGIINVIYTAKNKKKFAEVDARLEKEDE